MANVKIERLNHAFMEELSIILMTEVKDEDIKFVTITDVDITNDLSYAKVYFTVLDDSKRESTLKALNGASKFIRGKLSERVEIRHTPELKFIYDESIEYGNHIEDIIEKIHGKEDMIKAAEVIADYGKDAVLIKGGHLEESADDLLYKNGKAVWFSGKRFDNPNTHGTGCTLSSAIATFLAKGCSMEESVEKAKAYVAGAIEANLDLGKGRGPLKHNYKI